MFVPLTLFGAVLDYGLVGMTLAYVRHAEDYLCGLRLEGLFEKCCVG